METTMRAQRLMKRAGAAATAGGAGLLALSMFAMPVAAGGNPNFGGILSAASPTGFPVSPSSLSASSGTATVTFNVLVSNLTNTAQKVKLNFSADHILTYKGANIANGQPGQTGITFNGPANTTQSEMAGRQSFTLSLTASEKNHKLALTRTLNQCGYYQLDVWAPNTAPGAASRPHDARLRLHPRPRLRWRWCAGHADSRAGERWRRRWHPGDHHPVDRCRP